VPSVTRIFGRPASFARVILWDERGTGLSDPVDRVPTLDDRVDDLMARRRSSVPEASTISRGAATGGAGKALTAVDAAITVTGRGTRRPNRRGYRRSLCLLCLPVPRDRLPVRETGLRSAAPNRRSFSAPGR
jgi:hypothetical protein